MVLYLEIEQDIGIYLVTVLEMERQMDKLHMNLMQYQLKKFGDSMQQQNLIR